MRTVLSMVMLTAICTSCASSNKKDEKNPFDALTLKETLHEGKTSQIDVIQAFGAPDMSTEDSETKQDVWVYSKHSSARESNGMGLGALAFLPGPLALVGGSLDSDKSETTSKTTTLTLIFTKQKKLKSYHLTKVRI